MKAASHRTTLATARKVVGAILVVALARWVSPWLRNDRKVAILALAPSIFAVALFIYIFIGWTLYISVSDWNRPVLDLTFAGLKNWRRLFTDPRFHIDLRNLVFFAAGYMTQCIVIGFVLAALLNEKIKGEAFFRTVFLMPFAVSAVVSGTAWRWLQLPSSGINLLIAKLGFENIRPLWYMHPQYGMLAITVMGAWQFSGFVMALYLAGLRAIPDELREAAIIDGAGALALYRYVYIPMLKPVTFTAIVLTGAGSIGNFDIPSIIGTGPGFATDSLGFYMFEQTFRSSRYGLGAAVGSLMLFLSIPVVLPYLISVLREERE